MAHSPASVFPDGILSPSPTVLLSVLQSRVWHTTHSPAKSPTSPNGICKPIPASLVNSECKFSGVLECSIIFSLQVTKGKACQSNPSSTRRLNRGSCHTPKFALHLLKIFHTSILKDSSRVDQTNSLLDNQPKLGFGIPQIQMDF